MIVARATSPDVVVESRDENNFVASLRARAVPHTTRDAPTYRFESIRPPRASVRVFARFASSIVVAVVRPRSRAPTSNEMSLICERKSTRVSHSFASRSRILRRGAPRPHARAPIARLTLIRRAPVDRARDVTRSTRDVARGRVTRSRDSPRRHRTSTCRRA